MPVERITKEQLKERLDRGDKPTILDVRLKYAYEHSTVKLPGAIRVPPYAIESVPIPSGGDIVAYDSIPTSWSAPTSRPSFCGRALRLASSKAVSLNGWPPISPSKPKKRRGRLRPNQGPSKG